MYKHFLIAIDGSELANEALEQGIALAKKLAAKVTIVNVTEPWTGLMGGDVMVSFPVDDYEKVTSKQASEMLTNAQNMANAAGLKSETVHVKNSYPADGILETADRHGCDLIVMASHGRRGVSRILLGSQANSIVTRSTIPVLICR
jgi:nucleotide-binding universal stress UspA family protein